MLIFIACGKLIFIFAPRKHAREVKAEEDARCITKHRNTENLQI